MPPGCLCCADRVAVGCVHRPGGRGHHPADGPADPERAQRHTVEAAPGHAHGERDGDRENVAQGL